MLGLAMILLAAIFGAAAWYRKHFLNLVLESVQKGATSYGKIDVKKIIAANAALARKLGITDVLTDWWFSRGKGQPTQNYRDNSSTRDFEYVGITRHLLQDRFGPQKFREGHSPNRESPGATAFGEGTRDGPVGAGGGPQDRPYNNPLAGEKKGLNLDTTGAIPRRIAGGKEVTAAGGAATVAATAGKALGSEVKKLAVGEARVITGASSGSMNSPGSSGEPVPAGGDPAAEKVPATTVKATGVGRIQEKEPSRTGVVSPPVPSSGKTPVPPGRVNAGNPQSPNTGRVSANPVDSQPSPVVTPVDFASAPEPAVNIRQTGLREKPPLNPSTPRNEQWVLKQEEP